MASTKLASTKLARPKAAKAPGRRRNGRNSGADDRGRMAQIMGAALDLFAENDYSSVTVNQIADAVGIRHSLIYYYFENKEDLFHKTVESYIAETFRSYDAVAGGTGDPVEQIEQWFDYNIRRSASLRKLVKVMFTYSGSRAHPRSLSGLIDDFYVSERRVVAAGIAKGTELGLFHAVDPDRTAAFVSTHIDGIFFSSLMRSDVDMAKSMDELKRNLWLILGYDENAPRRE